MSETSDFDLIHPIRPPREVAPGYRGSLAIPDGIVWYRHRSEEDQDHQHFYDQLREMDDELREAFELEGQVQLKVPFEKQPGGSVSNGLRRVIYEYGPAGAVPFLGKLIAENAKRYRALVRKSQMICADEAKGKERASETDDEMQEEMTEEEKQQLAILREVRQFVVQQQDDARVGFAVNDKMGRLLDLLKRFSSEAEGTRNAAKGRCFLVVRDDLMVKTLHKLLEHHSISVASLSTEQLSMPGSDVWKLDFAEADYSVLIVPVVVDVKWELARCNVVHYDLIGSEAVKTMPLQKSQKRTGHRFYVFKAESEDQRDIRMEEDYGLQLDSRTKPDETYSARQQVEKEERDRMQRSKEYLGVQSDRESSDASSDGFYLEQHNQYEMQPQADERTGSNEAPKASKEGGRSLSDINMLQSEEEEFEVDDSLMRDEDVPDSPPRPLHLTCRADNVPLPLPARRFDLESLGLPPQGFQWIKKKTLGTYIGPRGRTLYLKNTPNPYFQSEGRKKGQIFSSLQLTNNRSACLVTNRSAPKVFDDVVEQAADRGHGDISMRETEVTAGKGSPNAKAYAFDSPPVMGLDTIVSDSGKRTARAKDYAYLTYIAALYMAGWLDERFEFVPGGPDRSNLISTQPPAQVMAHESVHHVSIEEDIEEDEAVFSDSGAVYESATSQTGSSRDHLNERAVSIPAPFVVLPSAPSPTGEPSNRNLRSPPIAPWNADLTNTMSANQNAGPSTGHHAGAPTRSTAGLPARSTAGIRSGPAFDPSRKLDAHDPSQRSPLEAKQPKFWTACTPLSAGSFCATLCRIKSDVKQDFDKAPRAYRTMCILTRHRFSLPMDRRLPTCRGVVVVDARLQQGRDVKLDYSQLRAAEAYTLKLFSIPRRRQVFSAPGKMPYLILPMSREWDLADKATSEMSSSEKNNTKNLAWTEIHAALTRASRVATGLESGGQGLAVLAEESVYMFGGSQYNEVVEIRRDEHARHQAEGRAIAEARHGNQREPVVSGPVFKLRKIPDFWKPGHHPPRDRAERYVCPKSEPPSTVAKSIYHSAHMLPWVMWTIDGLLLAQEVNMKYLGSRADAYDVLAALSTTASSRHIDCEVLEFAGDTYWKLAATAYHFHTSPTSDYVLLSNLVRSITDNKPLADGMEECGAVEYILNDPVDSTTFVPPGCGYQNNNEDYVTLPAPRSTLLHRKSIADVAEALAGAIGKLKDHELILQTCMRLFPSSFPSPITWQDVAQTSSSPDYGRIVTSAADVATVRDITGHSFNNAELLGSTLIFHNRHGGSSAGDTANRLTFLGSAIFDYSESRTMSWRSSFVADAGFRFTVLMSYLIEQGSIQKLGPGPLTRWRSPMSSHVGLAALWVTSGLHRVARTIQKQVVSFDKQIVVLFEKQVESFEKQLQETIDTHTELSLAWTTIKPVPRVEDQIYRLFAGVLIDSGWSFGAARAFFNRLCLPFFASFVGTYEAHRLMPILDHTTAKRKLQLFLACRMVIHDIKRGNDGFYRALVLCHDRQIGDASSVYSEAAQGFAYRDALSASADPVLANELRRICSCRKANRDPTAGTKRGAGWVESRPKPAAPPAEIRQADDKSDESSDDGFEIIENPNLVIRRSAPVAPATRKASVLDLTGSEDSDVQQNKKQRPNK